MNDGKSIVSASRRDITRRAPPEQFLRARHLERATRAVFLPPDMDVLAEGLLQKPKGLPGLRSWQTKTFVLTKRK